MTQPSPRPWIAALCALSLAVPSAPVHAQTAPVRPERDGDWIELLGGGLLGQPLVLTNQYAPGAPGLCGLLFDVALAPVPVDLGALGELQLALTPQASFLPLPAGDPWIVPTPERSDLAGVRLFVQGLGPVAAAAGPSSAPGTRMALSEAYGVTLMGTPNFARFVYTANGGDGSLSIHALETTTGRLVVRGYAPVGGALQAVAASPGGEVVVVSDVTAPRLVSLSSGAEDGDLSVLDSQATAGPITRLAFSGDGRFVYGIGPNLVGIQAFSVDLANGALAPLSPGSFGTLAQPTEVRVSPSGAQLIALASTTNQVRVFDIDPVTGALSSASSASTPVGPNDLTLDESGDVGFVLGGSEAAVRGYAVDGATGAFTPLGPAVPVGSAPRACALSPDGDFLYVSDLASGELLQFAVNATTGALTPLSPASVPGDPGLLELEADPSTGLLFGTLAASQELRSWRIEADGRLTPVSRVRTRPSPLGLAIARGSKSLSFRTSTVLVAHETSSELRAYQLTGTGSLVDLGGGTLSTAGSVAVAVGPQNEYVLTADFTGDRVSVFNLDASSGATQPDGNVVLDSAFDVAIEPTGRFAYASSSATDRLYALRYDAPSDSWQVLESKKLPENAIPRGVAIDPTGSFVYVTGSFSNSVETYRIDPTDGRLTFVASTVVTGGPVDLFADPSGRFVYVALSFQGAVAQLELDPFTGAPLLVSLFGANAANGTSYLSGDPTGRFLYAANTSANSISQYTIDAETGLLTPLGSIGVIGNPRGLAVDASGRYLVVSNFDSTVLTTYLINTATGVLGGGSLALSGGQGPRGVAMTFELD
jgi:6-phosphogluconolactonase (cycloisomerase 2 family)